MLCLCDRRGVRSFPRPGPGPPRPSGVLGRTLEGMALLAGSLAPRETGLFARDARPAPVAVAVTVTVDPTTCFPFIAVSTVHGSTIAPKYGCAVPYSV